MAPLSVLFVVGKDAVSPLRHRPPPPRQSRIEVDCGRFPVDTPKMSHLRRHSPPQTPFPLRTLFGRVLFARFQNAEHRRIQKGVAAIISPQTLRQSVLQKLCCHKMTAYKLCPHFMAKSDSLQTDHFHILSISNRFKLQKWIDHVLESTLSPTPCPRPLSEDRTRSMASFQTSFSRRAMRWRSAFGVRFAFRDRIRS